ncbi:MAG TPA: hypothetical protein VKP61_06210 [Candidatus Acidoferrum sp.]|nr:hypothetical protein [Candidatus Acidoferrum sp.]
MEHFPVNLERYEGAYALIAKQAPTTAVIFVHGFDGNPRTTWVDFEGMIEKVGSQRTQWSETDLFFYSYNSLDQIPVLAETFLEFLTSVATLGASIFTPSDSSVRSLGGGFSLGAPIDFSRYRGRNPYKNLILVGHSTGAVIIRDALRMRVASIVQKNENLESWIKNRDEEDNHNRLIVRSSLRFFAPAHLGVLAAGKLGVALHLPVVDRVFGCYLGSNPLYQNLRHDSPTIRDLRKATEQLYDQHKLEALKASSLFGQHEEIVFLGGYTHDYPTQTEPGHYHQSICKPGVTFPQPLNFVMHVSSVSMNA